MWLDMCGVGGVGMVKSSHNDHPASVETMLEELVFLFLEALCHASPCVFLSQLVQEKPLSFLRNFYFFLSGFSYWIPSFLPFPSLSCKEMWCWFYAWSWLLYPLQWLAFRFPLATVMLPSFSSLFWGILRCLFYKWPLIFFSLKNSRIWIY